MESKIVKFTEAESRTVVAKCGGGWVELGGETEMLVKGDEVSVMQDE